MARSAAVVALVAAALAGGAAAAPPAPSACDLLSPCPVDTVCRDLPEPAGGWSVGEPTFACELQRVLCGPDFHFDHTHKICVTDEFCPCTSPNAPCHADDGTCQPMSGNSCDAGSTFCTTECACGPEAPCFHQMACFPLVGGSCSPGTEFCPSACSSDPCPAGQVEVVPCSLDGDRVCGSPTEPASQQDDGQGDCLICAGDTSGPCKHLDGTCVPFHPGTSMCPSGTFACAPPVGVSNVYEGEGACGGCWPLTGGPCQAEDTVCWMADAVTGQCPPGTSSCSLVGSLEPEPTVVAEIVLSGSTPASEVTEEQKQLLKESIAGKLIIPPTHLVITSITDAPANRRAKAAGKQGKKGQKAKKQAGRKLAGSHTLVVEVTIVTPRESNPASLPGLTAGSAKERLVAAVDSGELSEAVSTAGLNADVSVDTNAINVDLLAGNSGASSGTGSSSSGPNEVSILPGTNSGASSGAASGSSAGTGTGGSSSGATSASGSDSAAASASTSGSSTGAGGSASGSASGTGAGAGQAGADAGNTGGVVTNPGGAAGQASAPEVVLGTDGNAEGGGMSLATVAVGIVAASVVVGALVLVTRRMRGGAERTGKVAPDSVQRINLNADGQLVDSDEDESGGKGKKGKGKGKGKSPGKAFVRTGSVGRNTQKVVPQVSPASHDADDMVAEDVSEFTPASFLGGTDSRAPTRAPSFASGEGSDDDDDSRAVARLGAGAVSGDEVRAAMRAVARGSGRVEAEEDDGSDAGARDGGSDAGSDDDDAPRRSRRLARKSDGGNEVREAEGLDADLGGSMPGLVED